MVKLICCDLDGTLIPYGTPSVIGEDVFGLVRRLAAHGILFCPASGRQYESLRGLFAPVAEHCVFLCDNGGNLFYRGQLLDQTAMPRAAAEEIAWDFWRNSDGVGEVMLSGRNMAYLMSRDRGMADRIRYIGNNCTLITDPAQIPEPITKVSMYIREGVAPYVDRFAPRWQAYNAAIAGPLWLDTTMANKGIGVQKLCAALHLDPAEVMAFGDNYNDVAMLDVVGTPYIMDTAAPPLLARYARHTPDPRQTLAAFLTQLEEK